MPLLGIWLMGELKYIHVSKWGPIPAWEMLPCIVQNVVINIFEKLICIEPYRSSI